MTSITEKDTQQFVNYKKLCNLYEKYISYLLYPEDALENFADSEENLRASIDIAKKKCLLDNQK